MMTNQKESRRDFLKTAGIFASATGLGTGLGVGLGIQRSAYAGGSDQINVALIGCGGRGRGALVNRLDVGDNVKVIAVADAFAEPANNAVQWFRNNPDYQEKIDIDDSRIFHGLEAYKAAIDCLNPGDEVVIANPPGFRPIHYRYAVERGVHVFMEKPCCVDVPGYLTLVETNKIADEKNLKVCVGFQRRYDPGFRNWVAGVHNGAIGDVLYTRVFWNGNGIWCRSREAGESELHYQVRNWYHFLYLCGDNILEQHIHNLDMGLWLHSKGDNLCHPVEANAQGGRTFAAGPLELMQQAPNFVEDRPAWDAWYQKNQKSFDRMGQAWDHFFVEFSFADSKMYSQCRHIKNCWNIVGQSVVGTNGYGESENLPRRRPAHLTDRAGNVVLETATDTGQFAREHVEHVRAIRDNEYKNDGHFAATASMTAVLGREAAFCGKIVKWDELVKRGKTHMPTDGFSNNFDQTPPVIPDANGFYEKSVPIPGQYTPFA